MIRLQWRLFFQSWLRILLTAAIFIEAFYQYIYTFIKMMGVAKMGGNGLFQRQAEDMIYIFILMLFLAYDFFREMPDAYMLEPLRVSRHYFRHDFSQFLLLFQILFLYAVLFLTVHICCHLYSGSFTMQLVLYFMKFAGNYILLNGSVAILLGWLLSRSVGKLLGYILAALFSCMVSPIMSSKLEFYVLWARGIYNWFRAFLIMPQGTKSFFDYTLIPVNGTTVSRGCVWIGIFVAGLALCYIRKKHPYRQWGMALAGLVFSAGMVFYMQLPASYYSGVDSLDAGDSFNYDQWTYIIGGKEQQEEDADFCVEAYDMELTLVRQMRAEVTICPDEKELGEYKFTLYHLYQVDGVTDENGEDLQYGRQGDYLVVYNDNQLETICVKYHGGCANFYSNSSEVNLPGWFAYYPVPGFHAIYEDYQYVNNTLAQDAEFTVDIKAGGTIYSDLERTEGNSFYGNSTGPSFLAGLVKETVLPGGVRYVYPYLDVERIPDIANTVPDTEEIRKIQQYYEQVVEILQSEDNEVEVIMCMPNISGDASYIYEEDRIIDNATTWKCLQWAYENSGTLWYRYARELTEEEKTEEEAIQIYISMYYEMKATLTGEDFYEMVLDFYGQSMSEFGYTEQDFEAFIIEQFGQEEWDYIQGEMTSASTDGE